MWTSRSTLACCGNRHWVHALYGFACTVWICVYGTTQRPLLISPPPSVTRSPLPPCCRLARRLPRHNGYKTLAAGAAASGQLAQLHPSCCPLREDADGLLPEFVVYHELVATSRPFLRNVSTAVCGVCGMCVLRLKV